MLISICRSAFIDVNDIRRLALILRSIVRSVCAVVLRFQSRPMMFPMHFVNLYTFNHIINTTMWN